MIAQSDWQNLSKMLIGFAVVRIDATADYEQADSEQLHFEGC